MGIPPLIVRNAILYLIGNIYNKDPMDLLDAKRGSAEITHVRHMAIYLMHVTCGFQMVIVGEMFSRDRTTISYACNLIENARDGRVFDMTLSLIEHTLLTLLHTGEEVVS